MATTFTILADQSQTCVTRTEKRKWLQILDSERLQLHLVEALASSNNVFINVGNMLEESRHQDMSQGVGTRQLPLH